MDESLEGGFVVDEGSHDVTISRSQSMVEYYDIPVRDLAANHGIPGYLESESFRTVPNAVRGGVERQLLIRLS